MRHFLKKGGEVPAWYANMLYRRENGLTWSDLTGVWPQPRFVTRTDQWYQQWEWTIRPDPPHAG